MSKRDVMEALTKDRESKKVWRKGMLHTGSTMLNLACTDDPYGGFLKGHYYRIAGQSQAAKTLLAMTIFAEAKLNIQFKKYRLIYDNTEEGNLMPLEQMFGKAVAQCIESPRYSDKEALNSRTIEGFYFNVDRALEKAGYDVRNQKMRSADTAYEPFIYTLDSHEGLSSEAELKKHDQNRKVFDKSIGSESDDSDDDDDTKMKGSYGDGKAKANSTNIRRLMHPLEATGSILLIISQLRDDPTARFKTAVTAGGKALRYYASADIWTKIISPIYKDIKGKKREIGNKVEFSIEKNRITGWTPKVYVDVYPGVGFDDIGSCVDFLASEKAWPSTNGVISAGDLGLKLQREKLIQAIERDSMEEKLRETCGRVWNEIREASKVKRKNKYAQAEPAGAE